MAVIETWLTQDLKKPVQVQSLCGNFFSHNGNANRIGVRVYDDGEPATLSGTVSGYAVLPDGTTVPCTGALSGNSASVLLPAAAYAPGNICVTIMLTSGTTITTLGALTGSVVMARTDTQVDPGSVVTDWTNTINAALQAVEGYTGNIIATPYASLTYPVPLGKYCIYNDLLYRCVFPIASSENWTASHWVRVKLADDVSDLKNELDDSMDSVKNGFNDTNDMRVSLNQNGRKMINYTTGEEVNVSSDMLTASDYGEISKGTAFLVYMRRVVTSLGNAGMAFYDANKTFIKGIPEALGTASGVEENTVNVPPEAKYARFTYTLNSSLASFYAKMVGNYTPDNLASRFAGKKISIIGDSIDTFDQTGYKINGYSMYYPALGITDVNQTWWKRVIDESSAELEINASYAGSFVTSYNANYPDLYARVSLIGNPDVVFITLGSNDSGQSVSLGAYDFTTTYTSLSESTFRTAYIKGIKAIQNSYPNAEIICIAEKMKDEYKQSIYTIAKELSCIYIDASDYTGSSGVHPAEYGMRQIASLVLYPTDKTFTQSHIPADSKAVGDAFNETSESMFDIAEDLSIYENNMQFSFDQNGKKIINYKTGEVDTVSLSALSVTGYIDIISGSAILKYMRRAVTTLGNGGMAFYDSEKNFIIGVPEAERSTSGGEENTVIIPDGAKYARFTYRIDNTLPEFYIKESGNYCRTDIEKLYGITNELLSTKVLDNVADTFVSRQLIKYETGEVQTVSSDNVVASGFIEIQEKALQLKYTRRVLTSSGTGGIAFYNASKVYISGIQDDIGASVGSEEYTTDIPSGAKYVRFTYTINNPAFAPFSASIIGIYRIDELEKKIDENSNDNYKRIVKAIDFYDENNTDDETIALALQFLEGFTGEKTLVLDTRDWHISSAILLQSNLTVVIDGVTIKQNDNTFDNVFRGNNLTFDANYPNGLAISYENIENIKIIGKNNASIEGPDVNRTYDHPSEGTIPMVGDYFGWRTHQVSLSACTNVEIAGISFRKTRGWCISFDRCSKIEIHDLYINSLGVKNGDGIDFRVGCSDIHVYNIEGVTNDDTVACTALYKVVTNTDYPDGNTIYPGEPLRGFNAEFGYANSNISNVLIESVSTSGKMHGVICLANGGSQVFDVLVTNLVEKTASERESLFKVYQGYGTGYQDGDLHDIRANNLVSLGADYVFQCNCKVSDVWINKLVQNNVSGSATDILYNDGITITNSGT